MPSLESLSSAQALDEFAKSVARNVAVLRSDSVEVNGGIKNTEELNAHLVKGRDLPFDYQRLIDESRSYK